MTDAELSEGDDLAPSASQDWYEGASYFERVAEALRLRLVSRTAGGGGEWEVMYQGPEWCLSWTDGDLVHNHRVSDLVVEQIFPSRSTFEVIALAEHYRGRPYNFFERMDIDYRINHRLLHTVVREAAVPVEARKRGEYSTPAALRDLLGSVLKCVKDSGDLGG